MIQMETKEKEYRQKLYEDMVTTGFAPLKRFIEYKKLEEDLSPDDLKVVMQNIEHNLNRWCEWLRFQKRIPRERL